MIFKFTCIIFIWCALCNPGTLAAQIGIGHADRQILYSTKDSDASTDTSRLFAPTDTSRLFIIKEITVEGNKYTRTSTILREVSFYVGSSSKVKLVPLSIPAKALANRRVDYALSGFL